MYLSALSDKCNGANTTVNILFLTPKSDVYIFENETLRQIPLEKMEHRKFSLLSLHPALLTEI